MKRFNHKPHRPAIALWSQFTRPAGRAVEFGSGLAAFHLVNTRLSKLIFQTIVAVCVSVVAGCGDRQRPARPWEDIRSEFSSQGEVAFDTQPTGRCRVGIPVVSSQNVATGQMTGVEGAFGSANGAVRYKFLARPGKYVSAYPVTMEDGTVVAVAVYRPALK